MPEKVSFHLVVRRGPQPHQSYEITQEVTTLGRDIASDIVMNDRETSRHHLRLLRSDDSVAVEDLGSTNGTFANGKRISGLTPLQDGDMIGLGETVILGFEIRRAQPPADEPPPQEAVTPLPSAPAESAYAPPPVQPPQEPGWQTLPPTPPDPYAPPDDSPPNYPAYADEKAKPPPADYGIPPAPQQYAGYDYDPYAVREEDGGSSRWLILGCFVFAVLACVCFSIVGLVLIDTLNLWCEAPIVTQIVSALGYCAP